PIDFRVALLPPVALHLGHGHALQAELSEGLAHLIELEWLDDRHHRLHLSNPSMFTAAGSWPCSFQPCEPGRSVNPSANSTGCPQVPGFDESVSSAPGVRADRARQVSTKNRQKSPIAQKLACLRDRSLPDQTLLCRGGHKLPVTGE